MRRGVRYLGHDLRMTRHEGERLNALAGDNQSCRTNTHPIMSITHFMKGHEREEKELPTATMTTAHTLSQNCIWLEEIL